MACPPVWKSKFDGVFIAEKRLSEELSVHPTHWLISTQVGNTVKRVVIIAAAMVVLGEAMEPVAMVGTTVAIAGVLLYSILKQRLA